MSLLNKVAGKFDKNKFHNLNEEFTFSEYLERCYKNPKVIRTAYQRIYDMIVTKGCKEFEKYRKTLVHYNFFDDSEIPIFGLEETIDRLMKFIKGAAGGFGTEKRILLLHGPVGSSKSTILRLLKKGMERYSQTDDGSWYTFKWINLPTGPDGIYISDCDECPMHEDPIKLIPIDIRKGIIDELNEIYRNSFNEKESINAYKLRVDGELDPRCK
ncbi:MAG: hypothetical protein WCJ72_04830, partial [Chryseobacterium sp.]